MEYPDYLKELMKELTATEFLKIAMKKVDEIDIKTEDELLLLDKLLYKISQISTDVKMGMLSPELQEKFHQRMADMKLDQNNFLNMLKTNKNTKSPYTNPKKDTAIPTKPAIQDKVPDAIPDNPDKGYRDSSDKGYRDRSERSRRSDERTPRRKRSESSSSSSSSSGSEDRRRSKDRKPEEKSSTRIPEKYSFSLKKPDSSSSRIVRSHDQEEYFERQGYEREEDFRRSPPKYFRSRGGPYRGTKKIFRPPRGFKH